MADLFGIRSEADALRDAYIIPNDQPGDFPHPQSGQMRQDQREPITRSMFALRHHGQQAFEFGIGEHSVLAHGNLMICGDLLEIMMLPLTRPRDRRLQIPRNAKDCGCLRRFRKPKKTYII